MKIMLSKEERLQRRTLKSKMIVKDLDSDSEIKDGGVSYHDYQDDTEQDIDEIDADIFLAPTGALGVKMLSVCVCVCVILCSEGL